MTHDRRLCIKCEFCEVIYAQQMDARRLQLLAAVVEHGSFTRAAPAVGLSQPSLSRHITSLEREHGVRLLDRFPSGVRATPTGAALARRGEVIGAQLAAARREIAQVRNLEAGQLRIAAFPTAAATLALDALVALRVAHQGLLVTIEELERDLALEALRTGRVDIALTFTTAAGEREELTEATLLLEDEMLLALSAHHPNATVVEIALGELHDQPWIVGTAQRTHGLIVDACRHAGFEPRIAAQLDNQPAIQAAIAADVGISLIPALACREVRPDVRLIRLTPPVPTRRVHAHTLPGPSDQAVVCGLHALRRAGEQATRALARVVSH
jgi:DNA-binding transcriptional LysR family regulator